MNGSWVLQGKVGCDDVGVRSQQLRYRGRRMRSSRLSSVTQGVPGHLEVQETLSQKRGRNEGWRDVSRFKRVFNFPRETEFSF